MQVFLEWLKKHPESDSAAEISAFKKVLEKLKLNSEFEKLLKEAELEAALKQIQVQVEKWEE